jgi:iron complex outermembrane receptor protein
MNSQSRALVCVFAALATIPGAFAQDDVRAIPAENEVDESAAEEVQPRRRGGLVEEIVVTAQKREENISDVPISIQAFSPDALAARGIESQIGLMRAVPSLDVGSQAGYATIFLRGVGTEAFLTADPSIASYVDGVYFPFSPTFIQDFAGIERVEVLKGPQGTLFGRNAVGGAINVTSLQPDFFEPKTTIDVTSGNFGLIKPRLYTNVPVTENLAVNLSAYYSRSDYHLEGTSAGMPLREQIDQGVRVKARWAPTDNLDVTLGWVRTRNQGNGPIGQNLFPSPLGQALLITAPEDPRTVAVDERLYGVADTRLISGQVVYNLPWLDVKLLGSDQQSSLLYNYDFDGSPFPYVSFDVPGHPADIQQGELQLISSEGMPGSDWLDLTAGVFYFRNTQGFNPVQVTVGNVNPIVPLLDGLNLTDSILGDLLVSGLGLDGRLYTVEAEAQVRTESIGYYLQGTARLTEWVALTLGGRYQDEDRGVFKSTITVNAGGFNLGDTVPGGIIDFLPGGGRAISWQQARDDQNRLVPNFDTTKGFFPKVTLDFTPFEDETLIFLSWQRAEKAHAYNAFAIYLPPQYIRPEQTTAYEIGLKTRFFDDLVQFNIAAFLYEVRDQQTQYVSLLSGGALAFENAPEVESKGIDFDLVAEVLPSRIEGLSLSLNGALIDARFGSYPDAAGYSPTTGLFSPSNDFSGNRQTRTPRFSGTVAATKLWTIGRGEVELGADYYYNSGFFYSASNDPSYEQEAYSLLGGFARYRYNPWNLDVRVFGNNLTDEFYTQGVISTDFGGVFTVAPPAQYGVRVSWEF